jgi:hypothetical protein
MTWRVRETRFEETDRNGRNQSRVDEDIYISAARERETLRKRLVTRRERPLVNETVLLGRVVGMSLWLPVILGRKILRVAQR